MGMNLTKKVCVKYGQTDDVEKKFLPFDELSNLPRKLLLSQNTLETIMTLLNCANCTTKTKMAPSFWSLWLIPRMKMASSPTLPSLTNCVESKFLINISTSILWEHSTSYNKT